MVDLYLSSPEEAIIEDIQDIGYGELFDVEAASADEVESVVSAHEAFREFFNVLRSVRKFDKVIIHGSLPAYGVIKTHAPSGRLCVKKYKFN